MGAWIDGHRARPVLGYEGLDSLTDFINGLLAGNIGVAVVFVPFLRVEEPFRMSVLLGKLSALGAGEAGIRRVVRISLDSDRTSVFDFNQDPAIRMTEATDRGLYLLGHSEAPHFRQRGRLLGGEMMVSSRNSEGTCSVVYIPSIRSR